MRDDIDGTSLNAIRQMVALSIGVTLMLQSYTQSEIAREIPELLPLKSATAKSQREAKVDRVMSCESGFAQAWYHLIESLTKQALETQSQDAVAILA